MFGYVLCRCCHDPSFRSQWANGEPPTSLGPSWSGPGLIIDVKFFSKVSPALDGRLRSSHRLRAQERGRIPTMTDLLVSHPLEDGIGMFAAHRRLVVVGVAAEFAT